MAVTTTNLIQGPADLYSGAFGATEPADTAFASVPDDGAWTDLGGTEGGVTLSVNQEYAEMEVDQLVDTPERRMTKREFTIATSLAEGTLANLTLALNALVTAGSGGTGGTAYHSLTAATGSSATRPTYAALIADGLAPEGNRRRWIGRKMLQTGNVSTAYSKGDKSVIPVTFSGHYVSPSVAPFKLVDQD